MPVKSSPDYHNDPSDRMLICQGIVSGIQIVSQDHSISQYPITTFLWIYQNSLSFRNIECNSIFTLYLLFRERYCLQFSY